MSCAAFRREWEPSGCETHAASCSACGEWLSTQRGLSSGLFGLAAQLAAAEPPSREGELRAAFRGSRGDAPRRPPLRWWLGWAAAAGVVGLVALVVRWPGSSAFGKRTQAQAPAVVSPSAKPRPSSQPTRIVRHAAPRPAPRVSGAPAPLPPLDGAPAEAAAASPSSPSEDASEHASEVALAEGDSTEAGLPGAPREQSFYPLGPDREPSAIESGQIVRVQLRPDVLSAAGLRSRTPGPGPVEAEVLMGPDGVALGIRLAKPKR
jgi:hypothetical protein